MAFIAICMGFLLIQLDATIVNVALPAIGQDLGGTLTGLQWIVDSYTLALAGLLLTTGSLADQWGARRIYLAGLLLFTIASATCAAAPTLGVLVAARAVQGIGAAALLPCSLTLLARLYPTGRERARALGVWGLIASLGLAAGPVLGGLTVAFAGWRIIFLANLPIGALTVVLLLRAVPETSLTHTRKFDVAGMITGVVGLTAATAGCIEAGHSGWLSPLTLVLLAVGAVAAGAFGWAESRSAAPMMPLSIFRSAAFSATVLLGLLFNLCLYGALLCLSLFLQQSHHLTALAAGGTLFPLTVMIGVGATASGRLTARFGPRPPMLAGMTCGAIGALMLGFAGPHPSIAVIITGSAVLGLCSLTMPAMTSVALGALDADRAGLASGVLNAARQAGGALGVALLGSLLVATGGPALTAPLIAVGGAYVLATALAWLATKPAHERTLTMAK
ncbi:MFS transporter [Fodinicola feengrottensis]|uniref:Multidrug resistance protein Stp n=2 Tax=Fodinicola feengrottensis TaxID=435914 RepID=A0ABN2HQ19_9ACTN|nr:MFS transporter [Fodinicola feengrottensis]